jgi:hypothetical protein
MTGLDFASLVQILRQARWIEPSPQAWEPAALESNSERIIKLNETGWKFIFVEAFTYDVVSAYEDGSNFGASWSLLPACACSIASRMKLISRSGAMDLFNLPVKAMSGNRIVLGAKPPRD